MAFFKARNGFISSVMDKPDDKANFFKFGFTLKDDVYKICRDGASDCPKLVGITNEESIQKLRDCRVSGDVVKLSAGLYNYRDMMLLLKRLVPDEGTRVVSVFCVSELDDMPLFFAVHESDDPELRCTKVIFDSVVVGSVNPKVQLLNERGGTTNTYVSIYYPWLSRGPAGIDSLAKSVAVPIDRATPMNMAYMNVIANLADMVSEEVVIERNIN